MQSFDHTFDEFPEGRWWIAWVDHVRADPGQPRRVHVTLARILSDRASALELRENKAETRIVRMVVSALPSFAVGDVIDNKRLVRVGATSRVASVCDRASGGSTVHFTFDAESIMQPAGTRLSAERAVRPVSYPRRLNCPILSIKEYRFPSTRNCLSLVVTDGPRTFLIPAAELLRTVVMPFSEPLGLLFDRDLPSVLDAMMVSPSGPPSRQGHFRLDLKEGYDRRHAPFVANLLEDYNLAGAAAAARIHHSLTLHDRRLPQRADDDAVTAGCSPLPCIFPFGYGSISIEAKCFELRDNRFLVAKIVGGRWPDLMPLEVSVARVDGDPATPPSGQAQGGPRQDLHGREPMALQLEGTPGFGSDPVELSVERLHWEGLPAVAVETRTRRPGSGERQIVPDRRERSGVAVGAPRPDGDLAPATAAHVAGPVVDRFAETHAMLMRLKAAGSVVGIEPVPSTDSSRSASRGSLPVWIWPGRKRWHVLKSTSGPANPRSLLILRIEVASGRFVHWFCIEPSDTKGYAALLVALHDPHSEDAVRKVVDEISLRSGKIDNPRGFARANGGRDGEKFGHALRRAPSGFGRTAAKQLSEARALVVLKRLCL